MSHPAKISANLFKLMRHWDHFHFHIKHLVHFHYLMFTFDRRKVTLLMLVVLIISRAHYFLWNWGCPWFPGLGNHFQKQFTKPGKKTTIVFYTVSSYTHYRLRTCLIKCLNKQQHIHCILYTKYKRYIHYKGILHRHRRMNYGGIIYSSFIDYQ